MKNKNYIIDECDNGKEKIRNCNSNIAKMNILEYIYCQFKYWHYAKRLLSCYSEFLNTALEFLVDLFDIILNTLYIILCPIIFPIHAYFIIKKAKKKINLKE